MGTLNLSPTLHHASRKVIKYPWAVIRTVLVVANNIYCVPTYLVWMFLLWPLKKIHETYYYRIEGVLFHWLLANVSMWSWTAGYEGERFGSVLQCIPTGLTRSIQILCELP